MGKASYSRGSQKQSKKGNGFTLLLLSNIEKKPVQIRLPRLFLRTCAALFLFLIGLTGYGLISAALLKPVARQKAALESEISALREEQNKIISENQSLKAYTVQQDKEMQTLQDISNDLKSNVQDIQQRDSALREKLGMQGGGEAEGQSPAASDAAGSSGESSGGAEEAAEYYSAEGLSEDGSELILSDRPRLKLAAFVSYRPPRQAETELLAEELYRQKQLRLQSATNYSQYEGVVSSREFQAAQKAEQSRERRASIVAYAMQFLGGKYRWGANDPHTGVDCSGFTRYVLGHAGGVYLNRTAAEQSRQGSEVSVSNIRPGDLLFYGSSGHVDHVAMYIGDGKVIHASNSRNGIRISSWNYRNPVRIKNMIGE